MHLREAAVMIAAIVCCSPLTASDDGLSKQIEGLSKQIEEISAQLRGIRTLLDNTGAGRAGEPEVRTATLDLRDAPVLGTKDAPITIVEFMDYECPYCQRFASGTFQDLKKYYIGTGLVRFYIENLPLDIHPRALLAAEAAACANEQHEFWRMHERLLAADNQFETDEAVRIAKQLDLDSPTFEKCLVPSDGQV